MVYSGEHRNVSFIRKLSTSEVIPRRSFACGTLGLPYTSITVSLLDQTRTFLCYLQDTTVHIEMPVGVDENRPGYGTPDFTTLSFLWKDTGFVYVPSCNTLYIKGTSSPN